VILGTQHMFIVVYQDKNMSKKTLIIIMSVVIGLVLLGGGAFVYFASKDTETGDSKVIETLKKLNPFGSSDPLGIGSILDNNPFSNTASTTVEGGEVLAASKTLFKLSEERSSGIAFADVLVPKNIEVRKKITIDDPLVASTSKPRKIQVMATTTETVYATTSRIRYVEQGSGHIYEYDYASSTSRKLTNTTIPKTQEAYFLDNGSKVLLRYLDGTNRVIENYLASIPTSSVADKLTGEFLPSNITAISVSPSTSEFFYIAKTSTGSIGNIYNVKSGVEKRVFVSAFSEWLPEWVSSGVFLTTKAHSSFPGFVYLQSIVKNTFVRVTSNKLGLTSLPNPDGSKLLIGEGLNMSILNISNGNLVQAKGLYTLPEKCVWKNTVDILCFGSDAPTEGNYPENWYQGKSYLADRLYSVSSITGDTLLLGTVYEMSGSDIAIDAVRITLSKDKKSLVLINKLDMTPWYLNVEKTITSYGVGPQ
jgi:hypothetical protein